MQADLFIKILVLQSKRLMRILINTLIFFRRPTHGVVVVQAADAALRPLDFAVQFVAFDVADDFAV